MITDNISDTSEKLNYYEVFCSSLSKKSIGFRCMWAKSEQDAMTAVRKSGCKVYWCKKKKKKL